MGQSLYNREFLERELSRRLRLARFVVVIWVFIGAIIGPAGTMAARLNDAAPIGLVAGVLLGFVLGTIRARSIRLQAQYLAVQVEIERHLAELVQSAQRPGPAPPPGRLG